MALTGTAFRNTATYFCNQGHELIGNKIRVCQENGNWDGQKPLCECEFDETCISAGI